MSFYIQQVSIATTTRLPEGYLIWINNRHFVIVKSEQGFIYIRKANLLDRVRESIRWQWLKFNVWLNAQDNPLIQTILDRR